MKEEQKADIRKFIKNRMEHLREDVHSMLNNFNLEIIRQFEVQRVSLDIFRDNAYIEPSGFYSG